MIKYELRRAFSYKFWITVVFGVLCGIGGIVSYSMDTKWNEPAAISAYEAFLYCLALSEASFYRALFPILICISYLPTMFSERKSTFIYSVTTRASVYKYLTIKIGVGVLSACVVIACCIISWFALCLLIFPSNIADTIVSYSPTGAFSYYYPYHPFKYIGILFMLNVITAAVFYLLLAATSFIAKKKRQVITIPFAIYMFCVLISQFNFFSNIDPIPLFVPFQRNYSSISTISLGWGIILITSCLLLFFCFRRDKKEIL